MDSRDSPKGSGPEKSGPWSHREQINDWAYRRYIAYCELVGVEALSFEAWQEIDRRVFGWAWGTKIS